MFDKVIANAADAVSGTAAVNDGDYYAPCFDDEPELQVLYCGVCGRRKEFYPYIPSIPYPADTVAPRQHRRYIMKDNSRVKVPVSCECERIMKLQTKNDYRLRHRAAELKRKCWGYYDENGARISNKNMESITFERYGGNVHIEKAKGYLESFSERLHEHKGITLLGRAGAGKTVASMCLANALMDKGYDVEFRQQFQIATLSKFDDKAELEELQRCTVLFIDDFSPRSLNEYGEDMLFNLIELRIKRGLITCYSANLTAEKIKKPTQTSIKRIFDRINSTTYIVEDSTHNYRT